MKDLDTNIICSCDKKYVSMLLITAFFSLFKHDKKLTSLLFNDITIG